MRTEHLTNLHPGWVLGGWLIAIAATSAFYLAEVGLGLFPQGSASIVGVAVAIAAGFYLGGLFVGLRWGDAPILHGAAMTFLSVLVWFMGSLVVPQPVEAWSGPTPAVLGLILLQLGASVGGGAMGRKMMLGGVPDPEEGHTGV